MAWFAAHIVIGFLTEKSGQEIPAWENITLIEAGSIEIAQQIADDIGKNECSLDDNLTVDDVSATRVFAGVRKISHIIHPEFGENFTFPSCMQGLEISFSEFILPDKEALMHLGGGEELLVTYSSK